MDDAAPAAGAAAEKKRRLLRRPPTSLIVTLLGIALTAWLLPAFTKQWDDRRKAHELQASIVTDMAAATSRTLVGAEPLWAIPACPSGFRPINVHGQRWYWVGSVAPHTASTPCERQAQKRFNQIAAGVDGPWARESLEIEARLTAYFDTRVVTAWQMLSWFMDRFDGAETTQAENALRTALQNQLDLDMYTGSDVGILYKMAERIRASGPDFSDLPYWNDTLDFDGLVQRYVSPHPVSGSRHFLELFLFRLEAYLTREVLNAHVSGYSTTTHDLLRDLIP